MKEITKESTVGPCWFKLSSNIDLWKKGLVVDNGDAGIIDMDGNIPEMVYDYIQVSQLPIEDMEVLMKHVRGKIQTGPFGAKQPYIVEDHANRGLLQSFWKYYTSENQNK